MIPVSAILADPAWLWRIWDTILTLAILSVVFMLLRLFREVTRGMADIFLATRAAAEEVGKERLLDYLDTLASDNRALQRAVRDLAEQREERQKTYREFLEWRTKQGHPPRHGKKLESS